MRRMSSTCGLLTVASALALAVAISSTAPVLFAGTAFAQGKAAGDPNEGIRPTTETTVPDNTYGEGGTKTTLSDPKTFEVLVEEYKDKNGTVRQRKRYPFYAGEALVYFFNEKGEVVGSTYIMPVSGQNPDGEWKIGIDSHGTKTVITLSSKTAADEREAAAAAEFAKTGELLPLTETHVVPPNLSNPNTQPDVDTKVEPPKLGPTPLPPRTDAKSASGTQSRAPRTCGEITDQAMLVAMGCTPGPAARTTAANRNSTAMPVATRASSAVQDDCIGNPFCEEDLVRRAAERGKSSPGNMKMPASPPYGMPGGPMPGMPSMPGR